MGRDPNDETSSACALSSPAVSTVRSPNAAARCRLAALRSSSDTTTAHHPSCGRFATALPITRFSSGWGPFDPDCRPIAAPCAGAAAAVISGH